MRNAVAATISRLSIFRAAGLYALLAVMVLGACTSSQINPDAPAMSEVSPLIVSSPIRAQLPSEGALRFVETTDVTVAGTTRPRTRVTLVQPNGSQRQTRSDDIGNYRFLNVVVPAGAATYRLETGDRVPDRSGFENDQRIPVNGFVQPGALVTLSVANTSTTRSVRSNSAGFFEFEEVPFNEGPNEFQIEVAAAGVQATLATFTYTLDTTSPVVTFEGVTSGVVLDSSVVSITGRLSERNVTIEYIDPETGSEVSFLNTSLNFDLPFFSFQDGRHNLVLSFTDSVGNSTERILNFQVDSESPGVVFTEPTLRRDFLTTVLEARTRNRLLTLRGFTSPHARIDAVNIDTGDTYSGFSDHDGSFELPPFRDAFDRVRPYRIGLNQIRLLVTDAAENQTDLRIDLSVPTGVSLPPPLAMIAPANGQSISSVAQDIAALQAGMLDPPLEVRAVTGESAPFEPVNFSLDGRRVGPPQGAARFVRCDPSMGAGYPDACLAVNDHVCLVNPDSGSTYPELRDLADEGPMANILRVESDPSCDLEVPPPPALLPDAGSNGCFSRSDGSRFRVVHLTRESASMMCPAGTTEARVLGPLLPAQWVQTEGAICADPGGSGECPFAAMMNSVDGISLQPNGIIQFEFDPNAPVNPLCSPVRPVDLSCANDGLPIKAGDRLMLRAANIVGERVVEIEEVLSDNQVRAIPLVDKPLTSNSPNLFVRIDRNLEFSVSDTLTDAQGNLSEGEFAGAVPLQYTQLFGPLVPVPLSIPEHQHISMVAGVDPLSSRVETDFRVLSPGRARIHVLAPANSLVTTDTETTVEGYIVGDPEVVAVEINGRIVDVDSSGRFRLDRLPLEIGEVNNIQISVVDTNGTVVSEQRTIVQAGTAILATDITIEPAGTPTIVSGIPGTNGFSVGGRLSDNVDVAGVIVAAGEEGGDLLLGGGCPSPTLTINSGGYIRGFDQTDLRDIVNGVGPACGAPPCDVNANPSLVYVVDGPAGGSSVRISDAGGPNLILEQPLCAPGARLLVLQRDLFIPDRTIPQVPAERWSINGAAESAIDRAFLQEFDFGLMQDRLLEISVAGLQRNQPGALDTDSIGVFVRTQVPFIRLTSPVRFKGTDGRLLAAGSAACVAANCNCTAPGCDAVLYSPGSQFYVDIEPTNAPIVPFTPQFEDIAIRPGDIVSVGAGNRTSSSNEHRYYLVAEDFDPLAGTAAVPPESLLKLVSIDRARLQPDGNPVDDQPGTPISFSVYPQFEGQSVEPGPGLPAAPAETNQPILTRATDTDITGFTSVPDAIIIADGILGTSFRDGTFFVHKVPLDPGINVIDLVAEDASGRRTTQFVAVHSDSDPPIFSNLCLALDNSVSGTASDPCASTQASVPPVPAPFLEFPADTVFAVVRSPVVELRGLLLDQNSGSGIRSIDVLVDGRVIDSYDGFTGLNDPLDGSGLFTEFLRLDPGANIFELRATDRAGNSSSVQVFITADLPDPRPPVVQVECVSEGVGGFQSGVFAARTALAGLESGVRQIVGVGDAATTEFNYTLPRHPIQPGTVSVTDGVETCADDGAGALLCTGGGTNTVNYVTGDLEVSFALPTPQDAAVEAGYTLVRNPSGNPGRPYCTHALKDDSDFSDANNPLTPIDLRSPPEGQPGAAPEVVSVSERIVAGDRAVLTGSYLTRSGTRPALVVGGHVASPEFSGIPAGKVRSSLGPFNTGQAGLSTITVSTPVSELCHCPLADAGGAASCAPNQLEPLLQVGDSIALSASATAQAANNGLYRITSVTNLCSFRQMTLDKTLIVDAHQNPVTADGMVVHYPHSFVVSGVLLQDEGFNGITIEATDADGRVSLQSIGLSRDTNPPSLTIQGAVDGFSISAVAPAVIVVDPNLCTSELVCPRGGLDPNLFGPGLPGAGEQALHIVINRIDENGETPVEIPGDIATPAVRPVLRGEPLRYGWAYFADDLSTPGVPDPVAVAWDGENRDGEPMGARNPYTLPAGYPAPYSARDPNNGALTLQPAPQVTGEVALANAGAPSAGPFAGTLANAPVVADIPVALSKVGPAETCSDINHDGDFDDPGECPGGGGTIDYATGDFEITFSSAVAMGGTITADYSHSDPEFPFVSNKSLIRFGISTASNENDVYTTPFPGDVSCFNSYGTVDAALQPGTGIAGPYDQSTGALSAPPLADGTFTFIHLDDMDQEIERCTDADFDGTITNAECTGGAGMGTIDYATRAYSITFSNVVMATHTVQATFNRMEGTFEAPLQFGDGTMGPFTDVGGTLDTLPVADGGFSFIHYSPAGEVERCTDADSDGILTNAECAGGAGSGTIDYATGQYSITFTNVVAMTDEIQVFSNASQATPNLEDPRPCTARKPVGYRVSAFAADRAGHASAADVRFDVVVTPQVRLISGALGLISENPALVALLSDTTGLRTLLLDRLDDSGVLYNQNLALAQILGNVEDPGPLALELIESGARDAFAGLLAALLVDPDDFGPAQPAMATLLDVVRLLIDNGTIDDLLPVIDNRFIFNSCTGGATCPTGPDGTAIFTFLSDILVSRNDADRTDFNGDNAYFRTMPGPVRHLLPLNKSLLSFDESVRLRGDDLNTTVDDPQCPTSAGGNTAQINALPADNLGFQPLGSVSDSVVNAQVGDRLRIVGGTCTGFEAGISQVLDNDTLCIDPLTAFSGCGTSNEYVVLYSNGPAQIPVIELLDLLIHSPREVIENANNILGDAGVFRSVSHVLEELFCSDTDNPDCSAPAVPDALNADDLDGLFHGVFQLTDDEDASNGAEFSERLIDELAALLTPESAPLVQGRGEALQIEKLFPIIDSILAGERDPLAPADRCMPDPMTPGFQPGLLDLACWADGTVDLATNNDYANMRHMDMLLAALETQARPVSTGESSLVEFLALSRELIDDPDDGARGYLGAGVPVPPDSSNVRESVLATLSPVLTKIIQNEILEDVILALSDLLNPRDETTLMARTFNGDLTNYDEEFVPIIHRTIESSIGPITPTPDPIESNPPLLRAISLPGTQRIDSSVDGTDDTSGIRGIAEALRSLVTPIGEFELGEGRNPGYPGPDPDSAFVDTPVCRESYFNGRSPIEMLVPILDQLLDPHPRRALMPGETAEDLLDNGEDILGRDPLTIILQGLFDDPHVDEQELPDEIDDCADPCRADGSGTGGTPGTVLVGSTEGDGIAVSTEVLEILPELLNTVTRFGFADDGTLTSIFDTSREPVDSCVAGDCYAENRLVPAQAITLDLALELDAPFQVGAGNGIIAFEESLTQEALDAFSAFDNGEEAVNYVLLIAAKIAEDVTPLNEATPLPRDTNLAPAAARLFADPDGDGDPIPDGVIDDLLPIARMAANAGLTRQLLDLVRAVRACGVDAGKGNQEIRGGALLRGILDSTLLSLPALSGARDGLCPAEAEAMGPGVDGRGNFGGPFDSNPLNRLMPPELMGEPQSPSPYGVLQGGFAGRGNSMGEFLDGNVDFRELGAGRSAHLCLIAPPPPGTELIDEECAFIDVRPAGGPTMPLSYSNGNLFTGADAMGDDLQSFINANCPLQASRVGAGIGSGIPGQFEYFGFLPDEEVLPGTLLIDVDAGVVESFVDNGDGTLSGTIDPMASGTIDYNTGRYTLSFNADPGAANFTAGYDYDPQNFCSWRIRMLAEPYNGCVGGEPIPGPGPGDSLGLGGTLASPISATNQSYLDFVLRSLAFLVRKHEGFVLPEPIAAGPGPAGQGRMTRLLDLLVSPVPLTVGNGFDASMLEDLAPVMERALRILVDENRFPVRSAMPVESPLESALRVSSMAVVELDPPMGGPEFGTLPFDSYPTSEILYLSTGPFDANCPDGMGGFRACVGNGVHDSFDLALIGLNSLLDQLENRSGQNGLSRHLGQPESGDVVDPMMPPVCADPAGPECGFSDDPAELFEFLGERLPIALRRLEPGLQILLESFDEVSRVGEFDPLFPGAVYSDADPSSDCHVPGVEDGLRPCVQATNLAAAFERLAYAGNCRPHETGETTNCRLNEATSVLGAPAPLGAEGLVLEGVVNDGALQNSATIFDHLIGQWMVRPNDESNYPEGVLHRERVLTQLALLGSVTGVTGGRNLSGLFAFVREILEDRGLPGTRSGRVIDSIIPFTLRLSSRKFAGDSPPNSTDAESPYDVIFDILFTLVLDPTDCSPDAIAMSLAGIQRLENPAMAMQLGDAFACQVGLSDPANPMAIMAPTFPSPQLPPAMAGQPVFANSDENAEDAVFRDVGITVERPLQPIFDVELFDQLLSLFDDDPMQPDLIERQLPFAGNLALGFIADPESCAQAVAGSCTPRTLLDPPDRTLMTYDSSTLLVDGLLADLQFLIPSSVDSGGNTCPPTLPPMVGGTPAPPPYITATYPSITSFGDRPYGELCDPLVSDDLNRDGRVETASGVNLCGTGASMPPCVPRAGNGVHSTADFFNELDNDPDGIGSPMDIGIGRQGDIGFVLMDDVVTIGGVDGLDEAFLDGIADILARDDPLYVVDHENEGPAPLRNRFSVRAPGATISPEAVDLLTALGELFFETQF